MLQSLQYLPISTVNTAVAMTLFFAVAWGLFFKDMLEHEVGRWSENRKTQPTIEYQQPHIIFTYVVTCLLTILFSIFSFVAIGFPGNMAAAFSGVMVIIPAALLWFQLGVLLQEIVQGGSKALDIDEEPEEEFAMQETPVEEEAAQPTAGDA